MLTKINDYKGVVLFYVLLGLLLIAMFFRNDNLAIQADNDLKIATID